METIEIRQKRGAFYFTIIFLPFLVLVAAYYVFLSGSSQIKPAHRYTFLALFAYSAYTIYTVVKKHKQKRPILIISEFSIEIVGDFKAKVYLWQDIRSWEIKKDDGTDYLILETHDSKKHVPINFLDKTPLEIESLLKQYKKY